MSDFQTLFDHIIAELGGRDVVMSLLDVGPSALSNYRKRGMLPSTKQALIDDALAKNGLSIDLHNLRLMAQKKGEPAVSCLLLQAALQLIKLLTLHAGLWSEALQSGAL